MANLFYTGGPLFMSILTIILIALVASTIIAIRQILNGGNIPGELIRRRIDMVRGIGLFGLVTGVLGQLIGLYSALKAIEAAGNVSPGIIFSGIKVSMITTLYGFVIFLIGLLFWLILNVMNNRMAVK